MTRGLSVHQLLDFEILSLLVTSYVWAAISCLVNVVSVWYSLLCVRLWV